MGFLFYLVKFFGSEVADREWVAHTEAVDGLIEDVGLSASQSAAVDNLGEVVAAFGDGEALLALVGWPLEAAQVFERFGAWLVFYGDGGVVFGLEYEGCWGRGFVDENGSAQGVEVIPDEVVLAFGQLEFLVDGGEDVVP